MRAILFISAFLALATSEARAQLMGPDGKRIFVLAPDKTAAAPAGN